jgi:hypothetical protein
MYDILRMHADISGLSTCTHTRHFQMLFDNYCHSYTDNKKCVTSNRLQQKLLLQRVGVHGASIVHLQPDHRVHVTGRVSATVQRHEVLRLEVQRLVLVSPQPVVYTDVVHGQCEMNNCSVTNALDHVMYFRRIRLHTRPIYCTFDDDIDIGACPLIESNNYIYKWEKPTAKSIMLSMMSRQAWVVAKCCG